MGRAMFLFTAPLVLAGIIFGVISFLLIGSFLRGCKAGWVTAKELVENFAENHG